MVINNAENYENNNTFNFEEYSNEIDNFDFNWTILSLDENNTENNLLTEWNENNEYDQYPYINDQDYKKYFAPETYKFKQLIWSCRFVSAIYWITQMKSYKQLVKNSAKKDENWNFIVRIPLSLDKKAEGNRHKIDISAYQNQISINGTNHQILHREDNTDSWNGIVALAMAIWEDITEKIKFDITRLEGWSATQIFLHWNAINGIGLETQVENADIKIDELKKYLRQDDTIVIAHVKSNNDWSFETKWNNNKSNHAITITKIINDNNTEYIQYYDPNFYELKTISIDDFFNKCFSYDVYCATDDSNKRYPQEENKKANYDENNKNSVGSVVDNTWEIDEILRNLRWDIITYKEDDKLIVESRGKRAEITKKTEKKHIRTVAIDSKWDTIWDSDYQPYNISYTAINFSNSNIVLNIDMSKLSNKYKWEKNNLYKEYLYLPKIANFINRIIYNYIDTEARNKENSSPFSIDRYWDLVLDDDPYNVNLSNVENSKRINMEEEWRERRIKKNWLNNKLWCLKHRSKLGINDKITKQAIVDTLNNMVKEKKNR